MNDIDFLGQRAAAMLVEDVARRVEIDDALREFHGSGARVTPGRAPRNPRRRAAVAAVAFVAVAALVAGLIVSTDHDRPHTLNPINETPTNETQAEATPDSEVSAAASSVLASTADTPSSVVVPVPRANAIIEDPHSIDLDRWLTGAPAWPTKSGGPYTIFDMSTIPPGWSLVSAGGGTSIPGMGRGTSWNWSAMVTSPAGVQYSIRLDSAIVPPDSPLDSTVPVRVRAHDGSGTSSRIQWHETDSLRASITAFDSGDHRAEEIGLADALSTVSVRRLAPRGLGGSSPYKPPPSLLQLRGTISGRAWSAQVTTAPPMSMLVSVDGSDGGGGFGLADPSASVDAGLQLSVSGVLGGVLVYGVAPSTVEQIRVELSDSVTIRLPVYTWTGGSAFVAPIPDGLDAVSIAYLDASGAVLHRTLLPEFAIPTTGGVGGESAFGDPNGTTIVGNHTPYDAVPISEGPDTSGETPTTAASTVVTMPVEVIPDEATLRARPIVLPALPAGAACPVTTDFATLSKDLGPMAGRGTARPVGLDPAGTLDFGNSSDGKGTAKVLWAMPINLAGPVLIRGRQLDGGGTVTFAVGDNAPANDLVLDPSTAASMSKNGVTTQSLDGGWYGIPTSSSFTAAGCYGFQIDSAHGSDIVIFSAALVQ